MEPVARRQPSDDWAELTSQLLRELARLDEGRLEEAELFRAYVQHAHVLAWRGVADGNIHAPEDARDCLRAARHFIERHMPSMTPAASAATEIHVLSASLSLASEALAARRVEDRLSEDRSKTERAILQVLADSRGRYLRRGEIHQRLGADDRPSPPRVGQILAQLHEENVVLRIHGRAQGNPDTAFYALSPAGVALCRSLQLIREEDRMLWPQPATAAATLELPPAIAAALESACDPNLHWQRRNVAHGVLATEGLGPRKLLILKALIAKTEANPDRRVQELLDQATQAVVAASRVTSVQDRPVRDATILFSQKPEQQPQPAELAFT